MGVRAKESKLSGSDDAVVRHVLCKGVLLIPKLQAASYR